MKTAGSRAGRQSAPRAPSSSDEAIYEPTEPLASAETDTETETFAWMLVAAFTAAAIWPLMHRA